MKVKLIPIAPFQRNFKRLAKKFKSLISEFEILSKQIERNPSIGTALGGGLFKIRLASQSNGKIWRISGCDVLD